MIADTEGLKTCPRCKFRLPPGSFNNLKQEIDGKDYYCKSCRNKITKAWRKANPAVYAVCLTNAAARKRRKYGERKETRCKTTA